MLWVDDHLVAANNIGILDCHRSDLGWPNHGPRVYCLLHSTLWNFVLTTFIRNPLLSHLRIWTTHYTLSQQMQNIFSVILWYHPLSTNGTKLAHCKLLSLLFQEWSCRTLQVIPQEHCCEVIISYRFGYSIRTVVFIITLSDSSIQSNWTICMPKLNMNVLCSVYKLIYFDLQYIPM